MNKMGKENRLGDRFVSGPLGLSPDYGDRGTRLINILFPREWFSAIK